MSDNISKHPDTIIPLLESITIGDLHANGVYMLYFLIKNGVLTLKDPKDYELFVAAHETIFLELPVGSYRDTDQQGHPGSTSYAQFNMGRRLTHPDPAGAPDLDRTKRVDDRLAIIKKALEDIKRIINDATVTNKSCTVRFIGDMLADRGPCDYSILLLLKKLQENQPNIDVRILLSNHDQSFISHFPFNRNSKFRESLHAGQEVSLQSLICLINKNLLDHQEINDIVNHFYLCNLKLIDISKSNIPHTDLADGKQKQKFYTHAPTDMAHLNALVDSLLGPGKFKQVSNATEFMNMVLELNNTFQKKLSSNSLSSQDKQAIFKFVWSREDQLNCNRHAHFTALGVFNFSGHDGQQDNKNGKLNGLLGKAQLDTAIQYRFRRDCPMKGSCWIDGNGSYGSGVAGLAGGASGAEATVATSSVATGAGDEDEENRGIMSPLASLDSPIVGAATVNLIGVGSATDTDSDSEEAGAAAVAATGQHNPADPDDNLVAGAAAAAAAIGQHNEESGVVAGAAAAATGQNEPDKEIEKQLIEKFLELLRKDRKEPIEDCYSRLSRPIRLEDIVAHANGKAHSGEFFGPQFGATTRAILQQLRVTNVTPLQITKEAIIEDFKKSLNNTHHPKP